ncbi:UNVERIFIED_CONTAM: Transmembrane proteinDDB [Sesamum radiatum]|uniref:Transmembrane proteinDDB n=1 Tax=Sesamum radiatum TaxID=300843 RepID=A0AAW2T328_SESRA
MCHAISALLHTVSIPTFHVLEEAQGTKAIIIIVLMAPLYAIDSYVGLLDIRGSETFFTFLDSIKECYEALVMAKFLALMYTYLNISISKNIVPDEIKGREIHHSFPMTLFQELAPHKPLAKFLCVKGIVFFCFWQGILLDILVAMGIIKSNHFWLDVEHLQEALQNVLVIVEMVFFSLLMQYAYSAEPYRTGSVAEKSDKKNE